MQPFASMHKTHNEGSGLWCGDELMNVDMCMCYAYVWVGMCIMYMCICVCVHMCMCVCLGVFASVWISVCLQVCECRSQQCLLFNSHADV